MPGRIFQNIILQFKDSIDTEVGVVDAEGTVIACTELSEIGHKWPEIVGPINEAEDSFHERGNAQWNPQRSS